MHIVQVLFIVINIVHSIEALTCPSGSILYTDSGISKCYKFYLDSLYSWTNCYKTCTDTPGGSMLCPGTDTLNEWINVYGGNKDKWIGYSASTACDQKKSYKWVDTCSSKPTENYSHWEKNQPDGNSGCCVYLWFNAGKTWDNHPDNVGHYCACEIPPLTEAPTFSPSTLSPSTVAPTTSSPSTVVPTVTPTTSSPSTVAPTTAVPSALTPAAVELPKCQDGWTLHCDCEWTSGPEKNNVEVGAVSVDTNAKVSSNDARLGYNDARYHQMMGVFVGAIGSLSMIAVLYLYTRSLKEIDHRSEYTRINDHKHCSISTL